MNESWRPASKYQYTSCNSHATSSTLYSYKSVIQDLIPIGTVANRVRYLQSLSSPFTTGVLQPKSPQREDSRTGFGRRLTHRFGLPALQNTKPDEESQIAAAHSFQGLKTPRIKHTEGHTNPVLVAKFSQSPDSSREPKPGKLLPRTNAAIPWASLSRSKATRSMGRKRPSSDLEKGADCGGMRSNRGQFFSQRSMSPCGISRDNQDTDCSINMQDAERSESTIATTSTLRRRSVRELFEQYGIERPNGLASSMNISREEDPILLRRHRCCHLCSWNNSGISSECWKCGHSLCPKCNNSSPLPMARKERSLDDIEKHIKQENSSPAVKQSLESVKLLTRPWLTPLQPNGTVRKKSSTIKFPAYVEQVKLRKTPPQNNVATPILTSLLTGGRVPKAVKDSPFLIADLLYSNSSVRLFPVDTDNSCMANTSVAEDNGFIPTQPYLLERPISQTNCPLTRSQPRDIPKSRSVSPASICLKGRASARTLGGDCVPEYIECHGYPRTGHSRCGSPVSSGIVGVCQHCLDDCQCAACQNTHHNVRCCLHADHQSIFHHHQTQQKTIIPSIPEAIAEENDRASPVEKEKNSKLQVKATQVQSSADSEWNGRAITPVGILHSSNLSSTLERGNSPHPKSADAQMKASEKLVYFEPSLQRKQALHHPNIFTLKKEPFTLPARVENPKNPASLGDPLKSDPMPERNGADTTFKVKDDLASRTMPYRKSSGQQKHPHRVTLSSQGSSTKHTSRRTSRRLSALFQIKTMSPVPLLNQKLKDHQEELKRVDREDKAGIAQGSVERRVSAIESGTIDNQYLNVSKDDRPASRESNRSRKRKWRLRLVDKIPSTPCENDGYKFAVEHRLSDDEIITEGGIIDPKPKSGPQAIPPPVDPNVHSCTWKDRFLEQGGKMGVSDLGVKGVTIILHIEGREDIVFKAESWTGDQTAN